MSDSSNKRSSLFIALAVIAGLLLTLMAASLSGVVSSAEAKGTPYYYNSVKSSIKRKPSIYFVAGYSTQRVVFTEWKRWGPNKAVGVGKAEGYPVKVTFSKPCRAVSYRFWGRAKLNFSEGYPSGWYASGFPFTPSRSVKEATRCSNLLTAKTSKCRGKWCQTTKPFDIIHAGKYVDRIRWKQWGGRRAIGVGKLATASGIYYGSTRVVVSNWRWCPRVGSVLGLRTRAAGKTINWSWRKYCKK